MGMFLVSQDSEIEAMQIDCSTDNGLPDKGACRCMSVEGAISNLCLPIVPKVIRSVTSYFKKY